MAATTNQFQMLRARIENSLKAPYTLLLSSAMRNDGKTVCAQGLAESMAAAGYRTLLVDLDHERPTLEGVPFVNALGTSSDIDGVARGFVLDAKTGITVLSLADAALCASASKENVARTLAQLRTRFQAIVIDAGPLARSSIGVLFARECDAVILTAREGRSIRSEDRALLDVLQSEGANFFGVVTVGAKTIDSFRSRAFVAQESRYKAVASVPHGRTVEAQAMGRL